MLVSHSRAVWSRDPVSTRVPWGERHTVHRVRMALQGREEATGAGLPQPRGVVNRPGEHAGAIGENATLSTMPVWPCQVERRQPVLVSHSRAVPSLDPVSTRVPSGENATLFTGPIWPCKVERRQPVLVSQSLAVWSLDPVSTRVPSGENATLFTQSAWPCKVERRRPVLVSHSRAV